jgi:sec-independent protein translocase protein TatB
MFDFGFQELVVIFVVALVVLGPRRMQQLATTVGRWLGKARAMARQFREQLENEINVDEITGINTRTGSVAGAAAATPPPPTGMDGNPPPAPGTAEAPADYGGYPYGPYGAPPAEQTAAATDPAQAAAPQPGDDTYSHAHAASSEPMPYYPPEAESFNAAPPPVEQDPPYPHYDAPVTEPAPAAEAPADPSRPA